MSARQQLVGMAGELLLRSKVPCHLQEDQHLTRQVQSGYSGGRQTQSVSPPVISRTIRQTVVQSDSLPPLALAACSNRVLARRNAR